MNLITRWILSTVAVGVTAYLLPGVALDSIWVAVIVAVVLGLVNVLIRPLLVLLTLPVTIVTLGLFLLVINAGMVLLTSALVSGFHVASFWWALLFSIIMSIISAVLKAPVKAASHDW